MLWKSAVNLSNFPGRKGKEGIQGLSLNEMEVSSSYPARRLKQPRSLTSCDLFLEEEISLEANQTGLCNFPLAASLHSIAQNISTTAWLHLSHPLIDLVYV